MKNLANCKPSEVLKQTNRVKKSAERWLKATEIMEIRKHLPTIPDGAKPEEKRKLEAEQARQNISDMLDAIMDKHPEETLELLALCCFVEPEHVDDYPVTDYLGAFGEMIGSDAVVSFFTSLIRLGQIIS